MGHTPEVNMPHPKPKYAINAKDVDRLEQRLLKVLKATGEYAALLVAGSWFRRFTSLARTATMFSQGRPTNNQTQQ
jgi:hypothetical protein